MQRVQEASDGKDEELIAQLRMLGLTDYESKAYYTLVQSEELTAEEVSKQSGIPLPRVYSVLDALVEESFIKTYATRPMKFEALPPSVAFARLEKKREQEVNRTLSELKTLAANVRTNLEPTYWKAKLRIRPEELLESLTDLSSMEERTRSMISAATEEILILTAEFRWFPKVYDDLAEAVKKGVTVRVLMNTDDAASRGRAQSVKELGVEVRSLTRGTYPLRGTIVDKGRLLFLIWSEAKEQAKPSYIYRPSYTENRGLIRVFLDAFEKHWEKAKQPK